MLCYVTRPDAVLMEVEVEAKANGEDCLNQVRAGARRGPAGAPGRGASRQCRPPGRVAGPGPGGGAAAAGERALAPALALDPRRGARTWAERSREAGARGGRAAPLGAATQPSSLTVPEEGGRRTCRR